MVLILCPRLSLWLVCTHLVLQLVQGWYYLRSLVPTSVAWFLIWIFKEPPVLGSLYIPESENCWFRFFKCLKQRTSGSGYFQELNWWFSGKNWQRTGSSLASSLTFFFGENHSCIPKLFLWIVWEPTGKWVYTPVW
jgi:hypothetical protein